MFKLVLRSFCLSLTCVAFLIDCRGTCQEVNEDTRTPIKKLDDHEIKRLGRLIPDVAVYEVDINCDGNKEVVVHISVYGGVVAGEFHYLQIYEKDDDYYWGFGHIAIGSEHSYYDFQIVDMDDNGYPDMVFEGSDGGSSGSGGLLIYEWNGEGFTFASTKSDKGLELSDIDGDGTIEIINWTYLESSLDGHPCNAAMVLWPDVQVYSSGSIVLANEYFPGFYRELHEESTSLLKPIQDGTADEYTLRHREYFERTRREIVSRCEK